MIFKVLSLDLSITNTGWAIYDKITKHLLSYGELSPDVANPTVKKKKTFVYPEDQIRRMHDLVEKILKLIVDNDIKQIVIEEINRGKARIQQKILDGLHFILLYKLPTELLHSVVYIDSDGTDGWRSRAGLGLQLSEYDKEENKKRKRANLRLKGKEQLPIINQKHLCCRFVNKTFGTSFDVDVRKFDADIADAIGLGYHYVRKYS